MEQLVLLVDENVPTSVTEYLRERGHEIHLVSERFPAGTQDPVIAAAATRMGAVVVTWNHKDFSALAVGKGAKNTRFPNLSIISFKCKEVDGRARLEAQIEMVETVCSTAQASGRRVLIEVRDTALKVLY
jgi:predicted nuclease of predicted toxin-antitoxin system